MSKKKFIPFHLLQDQVCMYICVQICGFIANFYYMYVAIYICITIRYIAMKIHISVFQNIRDVIIQDISNKCSAANVFLCF